MTAKKALPLASFPFCHDFALTNKHAIFFINSIVFGGMGSVILGRKTISDQVHFDSNQPMQILVVDLESLDTVARFETDPGAIIHFGNAFEEGNELIVDGMYAGDFDANETLRDVFAGGRFGGGIYRRYRLNLDTQQLTWDKVTDTESEFPTFNTHISGQKHQYCYTACSIDNGANSFFNGFQKVTYDGEATVVTLPPGYYGSEPLFAPTVNAKAEDDGYLLEVVYNAFDHLSELQIYRADDPADQVAKLTLKHHLPHQFHGYYAEQVFI